MPANPANAANPTGESAGTVHELAAVAGLAGCSDPTIAAITASNDLASVDPPVQEKLNKSDIAADANDPAQVVGLVTEPPVFSTADEPPDPDRWCWPLSSAMNTAEIATMEARLHLFGCRGLDPRQADALADKLLLRDRDLDERRLCFECQHLQVQRANHWRSWPDLRCGNWKASGLSLEARHAGMSEYFAHKLQRCDGFKAAP